MPQPRVGDRLRSAIPTLFAVIFSWGWTARRLIRRVALPMCSTPQVLIADDTTLLRWAVRRALNGAGFGVIEAETRSQVLEALISRSFRLVILSLALVGDDMEDIARAISSPAGNTALIVLTENGMLPDALRFQARVKALDKPFSVTSLIDAAMTLVPFGVEPSSDSISL